MADLHPLLRRQLRKVLGGTDVPDTMKAFVTQVNEAYLQADDERRMLERAFDLSSQELMDANEELAEASRAKDRFLAMLGHELRNPLAPIVMALEVAALRNSSSVDVRDLERPVRQVLRLVDDLLDIARVARGTLVLEKRAFEVSHSVRDAVEAVQPAAAQAGLVLRTDVPPSGLIVDGDEGRLTQVVSNLLVNAVRHTEPGGVILVRGERAGADVVLGVSDNGQGIDPELLPQIFDSFVRSRTPDVPHGAGLGLGLTIVRSIVELHGGTVTARSAGRGHGATFEVRLPALAPTEIEVRAAAGARAPGAIARKILIVDDNRDVATLMGSALRIMGHEVALAFTAAEALGQLESFTPEVALLDVALPDMNGRELGARLRQHDAAIKLIAVTGYGQPSDSEASRRAGFAAHLVKPVDVSELAAVLDS
jgi:signal transduction histidine kinase/CheY-like chemotaxis protein